MTEPRLGFVISPEVSFGVRCVVEDVVQVRATVCSVSTCTVEGSVDSHAVVLVGLPLTIESDGSYDARDIVVRLEAIAPIETTWVTLTAATEDGPELAMFKVIVSSNDEDATFERKFR